MKTSEKLWAVLTIVTVLISVLYALKTGKIDGLAFIGLLPVIGWMETSERFNDDLR